jgi:hypothetical protein
MANLIPTLPKGISYNYNQQGYSVLAYLYNLNEQESIQITPNSIINLTIDETFSSWVVSGSLTLVYGLDTLESTYKFRNDGYDTLTLRIYPNDSTYQNTNWELNYFCSITNIEDIPMPPGATGMTMASLKCKKLYFNDFRYQKLNTELLQYSTAFSLSAQSNKPNATDSERSLPTGGIIQEIIKNNFSLSICIIEH